MIQLEQALKDQINKDKFELAQLELDKLKEQRHRLNWRIENVKDTLYTFCELAFREHDLIPQDHHTAKCSRCGFIAEADADDRP